MSQGEHYGFLKCAEMVAGRAELLADLLGSIGWMSCILATTVIPADAKGFEQYLLRWSHDHDLRPLAERR